MTKTFVELAEMGRLRFQELMRELQALIVAFPDLANQEKPQAPRSAKRRGRKRGYTLSPETRERMRRGQQARHARARLPKANGSEALAAGVDQHSSQEMHEDADGR